MIKILKDLGNNHYEVEVTEETPTKGLRECAFGVVHDYVHFDDFHYLNNADYSTSSIRFWTSVHIPIRTFVDVVLPRLLTNKYCKEEHLADREYTEDDKYHNPPQYKKGDKYPAYSYQNTVIFFWENGERMAAFILRGDRHHSVVTAKVFNLIKDKLDFLEL